jgi:hypothetical protein
VRPRYGAVALAAVLASPAIALERSATDDVAQNYTLFCAGCHGEAGVGVPHKIPRLAGRLGLYLGVDGGRDFLLRVPGVANSQLDAARLAAVMNRAVARFAPERMATFQPFTAAEIAAARRRPLIGVERERSRLLRAAGVDEATIAAEY